MASSDGGLIERVAQALNFGFAGSRNSRSPSVNGKMSEYHAAVGLAALDGWDDRKAALQAVVAAYRKCMGSANLEKSFIGAPDIGLSYVMFRGDGEPEGEQAQARLRVHDVETRLWYDRGLHRQSHFFRCARDELPVTDRIAPHLLGLPMAPDLETCSVERVVRALSLASAGT